MTPSTCNRRGCGNVLTMNKVLTCDGFICEECQKERPENTDDTDRFMNTEAHHG